MTPIVGLFLVALIEVALGIAVWVRNPSRPVNRWFATFATTLAVWGTLSPAIRRAPRVLWYFAREAWVGRSSPAVSRSAMCRHYSCIAVSSSSIWVRRSCTIWNFASGLPNCTRCCEYDRAAS